MSWEIGKKSWKIYGYASALRKSYMNSRKFIYKLFHADAHPRIILDILYRFKAQDAHEMDISHDVLAFRHLAHEV